MTTRDEDGDNLPLPESEEEDASFEDYNTCTDQELERLFQFKCKILDEQATTLKKDYILSLCKDSALTTVVAGLSNGIVHVFDVSSERGLVPMNADFIQTPVQPNPVNLPNTCGVRFLDETNHLLLVGTADGFVRMYDMRAHQEVKCFKNIFDCNFTCFDTNSNERVLCVGTNHYQNQVFLIFYDIRQGAAMGNYCDCHEDEITAVNFHADHPDLLCSGAMDGLINAFDIHEQSEDDALQNTINTESTVLKLNWHKDIKDQVLISCVTHTNDFKLFDCVEGDEIVTLDRDSITAAMKRSNPANCNLINAHDLADGSTFLLAGTNFSKGEILRTVTLQNKSLTPFADFEDNKQIVRESIFDQKLNIFVTGGESGIVSLWNAQRSEEHSLDNSTSMKLKVKTKTKHNKTTPY